MLIKQYELIKYVLKAGVLCILPFSYKTYANIRFFHSFIQSLCYSILCILVARIELVWFNYMGFNHWKIVNLFCTLEDSFHIQCFPFL